nr:hypothetical protein HK105_002839 [Polyrhizophydium stewartii]
MEAFETRLLPWLASGPQRKLALDVARASQGTGIVIPVGTRSVPRARAAIRVLRAIGCRLPVVIAYFGDGDLAPDARKQLKRLEGVELMDMQPLIATEGIREGWHLKPFAALVAPFRNVLLMDADALFFRPPEELVDMPQFTRTGALLFRDRTLPYGHLGTWGYGLGTLVAQIRKAFGRQPLMLADTRITHLASAVEIDSGVVVWDKMRAMPAIMAACLLNSDPYVTYGANKSHGDKELIWLGHEATRLPVAAGPSNGGAIGTLTTDGAEFRVCGPLYHPGNDGRPLWINGGLGSREPVAEPKVEVPAYWAVEYDAKDVKWFLDGGFCLYGKLGNGTGTRIGGLIAEEKRIAQLMASIWREEMTLPKKLPPLTFDEDENSTE